jgi:hypothetical protein
LHFVAAREQSAAVEASNNSVTLTGEQLKGLRVRLSDFRHNINNQLARVIAVSELIRRKPESADHFVDSATEISLKIRDDVRSFSDELERLLSLPE